MDIILASNNKNKLVEMKEKLSKYDMNVISQKEAGYNIDVEETGTTFRENAVLKAEAIYKISKMPVIADDSGLEIDSLNGAPGVYSHRFAGPNSTDEDRINKVLELLENVPEQEKTARFKTAICYIDKNGTRHIFEGIAEGKIGLEPKGNNGFGFDPIFICEKNKTFAELTREEKNEISHRGKAIERFIKFLEER